MRAAEYERRSEMIPMNIEWLFVVWFIALLAKWLVVVHVREFVDVEVKMGVT